VRDENNAILLARFIVEPQDEETIVFDQNRSQDLSIVKNVFKKLVGNYKLLDEDEEREIVEELGEVKKFLIISKLKIKKRFSQSMKKVYKLNLC